MQMQEPERRQQSRQQEEGRNDYADGYPSVTQEQPDYVEVVVGEEPYQDQKIHPQQEMRARIGVMPVAGMVLSAIGFCASVAGIVLAAIVLRYGPGSESKVAGGIGLAAAIFVLLICIAIFIISTIVLAVRYSRARGRRGSYARRYVGSRYR